jgi:hypothetical protein
MAPQVQPALQEQQVSMDQLAQQELLEQMVQQVLQDPQVKLEHLDRHRLNPSASPTQHRQRMSRFSSPIKVSL